ncbi:MAG: hypothetical protein PHS41_08880 [Victivallaceae bacterium]|nr:hypothetical protein [Victivallaceae bacterium]
MPDGKTLILGIGRAGCHAVARLRVLSGGAHLILAAVDTDEADLVATELPEENRLLAAYSWRGGRGCGGSVLNGQRSIAREREALTHLLSGSGMVIVVGGLGGGTASGGMPVIASVLDKLKIPCLFFCTLPFSVEGHNCLKIAEDALELELIARGSPVIALPNDLLYSTVLESTTPLKKAFDLADTQLARILLALSSLADQQSLLPADFEKLREVLTRRKSLCRIGTGRASRKESGEERCQVALERLLQSPLLGSPEKLREADAVFVALTGDESLAIGETRSILEDVGRLFGAQAHLIVSASVSETMPEGEVLLTVLAVNFSAETVETAVGRTAVPEVRAEQLTFTNLNTVSKGIMEKTTPVIIDGVDLDTPTWQRRNLLLE